MSKKRPPFLKTWIIAVRPFALPASTMPVIFGTAAAVVIGGTNFKPLLFILAFFTMVILHSGANLLSDVNDFKMGLDSEPTPVSGAIVRGYISPKIGFTVSILLITVGFILGVIIVVIVGLPILIIGVAGIIIGVFYTLKPIALKYRALGDLAVFLDFGILGALGSWTVQTGRASWVPVVWAVPMSLLVVAIVHANNWRDIEGDKRSIISTVALLLGDRGSFIYYGFLIFGAYGIILLIIVLSHIFPLLKPTMPLTFFITFSTFPYAVELLLRGKKRKELSMRDSFITLDASTSLLNLLFGLLSTFAIILHFIIRWIIQ